MTGPGYRRFVETHGETSTRNTRELVRDLERFRRDLDAGRRIYDISGELSKRDTRELIAQIERELEQRSRHDRVLSGVAGELAYGVGAVALPEERTYRGRCNSCGDTWLERDTPAICPECHSLDVIEVELEVTS